jgi:energy-coupling factor transporter ATP-binding protein EcfA2
MLARIYRHNKNNLVIVCGETGSGKSWRALRIAELLTAQHGNIHIVFKTHEFFKLLDAGKIKKGDVVIWEEGGVEASNRNWYTEQNKVINYAFQTMRHRNFSLIMTVPSIKYIDSGLRSLFHVYIESLFVDKDMDACKCRVLKFQHNPLQGKTYHKYFRLKNDDGSHIIAKRIWVDAPSKELVEEYEKQKMAYTNELYKESLKDIEKAKKIKETDWGKPKEFKSEVKKGKKMIFQLIKTFKNGKQRIDDKLVKSRLNVSYSGAKVIASELEAYAREQNIIK